MEITGGLIIFILIMVVYFLPSYIGRKQENFNQILILNLFLGWSLIGWVVALIWAVKKQKN